MAHDGSVIIDIDGDDSKFKSKLAGIGKTALKASKTALVATSAAVGAFAVTAVKAGAEFESAFAQVQTIMDETVVSTDEMSTAIRSLSTEVGVSASELSQSVYNAISATGDTAGAVSLVADATRLATAGFTDSESALSTLTTAINAYGMSAADASAISDSLIATQNLGVTTVAELSAQMGKAIATGSAYGVNLANLESAYVSLTKNGINTAESTTYISSMLNELGDAGSNVSGILQSQTGKSFGQLMNEGKSLSDVLGILYDSCGQDSEAMMNLWSSAEAGKASSAIVSQGLEKFNDNLNQIENSAGLTEEAYEKMTHTLSFQTDLLKTNFEELQLSTYDLFSGDLAGVAENINGLLSNLNASMQAGDTAGFASNLGATLSRGIADAIENIPDLASKAVEVATQFITGFVNGFTSGSGMIQSAGSELIGQLTDSVATGIPEFISSALPMLVEFSGSLRSGAGQLVDSGIELVKNIAQGIADSIPTLIENVPAIVTNIAGIINDNAPKLLAAGLDIIVTLAQGIWEALPTLVENIPQIFEAIVSAFAAFNWVSLGSSIINGLKTAFTELPNELKFVGENAMNAFKSINWAGVGTAICNFIHNAIVGAGGMIANGLRSIGTNGLFAFRAINWASVGRTAITLIGSAIRGAGSLVMSGLRTVGTNAMSAFRSINWGSLGSNIISGIVRGISGAAGSLFSSLRNLASNALSAAKSALGIASPSKMFRDRIGKWIPLGIAAGIDREASSVEKSLDRVVNPRKLTVGVSTNINELNEKIVGRVNAQADMISSKLAGNANTDSPTSPRDRESGNRVINYTSNFYSPKQLTRKEIHRQAKQDARRLKAFV